MMGNTLAVQWLGLLALTVRGPGSLSGRGTKIPQAVQLGGEKKKNIYIYIYRKGQIDILGGKMRGLSD